MSVDENNPVGNSSGAATRCSCSGRSAGRRQLLGGVAAVSAAALLTPLASYGQSSNIAMLEGEVLINGRRATSRDGVVAGDQLRTGADGRILFSVGDSAFNLRPNSDLTVERGARLFSVAGLRLLTGAVVAVFGRGPQRRVITPTATAGIRGTGVYCEANPGETYFCTCYGNVDLSAGGWTETVFSERHEARRLGYGKNGGEIQMMPDVHHTDEELEQLEQLVGRHTPWVAKTPG